MNLKERLKFKELFYRVFDKKTNRVGTKEDMTNLFKYSSSHFKDCDFGTANKPNSRTLKGVFIKNVLVYEDLLSYVLLHFPLSEDNDHEEYDDQVYMKGLFKAVLFYEEQWKDIPFLSSVLESLYEDLKKDPDDFLYECRSVSIERVEEEYV